MFVDNLFHKQTGNLLTIKMIPCLLKLVDRLPRYNIFPPWVTHSLIECDKIGIPLAKIQHIWG